MKPRTGPSRSRDRDKPSVVTNDSAQVLRQMEAALETQARTDVPIERSQAAAFAHVLRRLLDDSAVVAAVDAHCAAPELTTKHREIYIGLSYQLRFEVLKIERGGRGLSKMAKHQTAQKWQAAGWHCSEPSVGTFSSKHKRAIDALRKKLDGNFEQIRRRAERRRSHGKKVAPAAPSPTRAQRHRVKFLRAELAWLEPARVRKVKNRLFNEKPTAVVE